MPSATIKIGKLISWSRNFDVDKDENVLKIVYYPNETTELHVQPDDASITKLKAIRDEIQNIMQREVTLSGSILEHWKKQQITTPESSHEEWILVT